MIRALPLLFAAIAALPSIMARLAGQTLPIDATDFWGGVM